MKLNKREVVVILQQRYVEGNDTLTSLAALFGVTPMAISHIGAQCIEGWRAISRAKQIHRLKFSRLQPPLNGVESVLPRLRRGQIQND